MADPTDMTDAERKALATLIDGPPTGKPKSAKQYQQDMREFKAGQLSQGDQVPLSQREAERQRATAANLRQQYKGTI